MQDTPSASYRHGRRLLLRLSRGSDVSQALGMICERLGIETAAFSIFGSLSQMTTGVFDQKQQVYVTHQEQGSFEILSCLGHVARQGGGLPVHARLIAADTFGRVSGGVLFSPTLVFEAELDLQELLGAPPVRVYDPVSGLTLWQTDTQTDLA